MEFSQSMGPGSVFKPCDAVVLRAQEEQYGLVVLIGDEESLMLKGILQFRFGSHRRNQKLLAGKGVGGIWIVQGSVNSRS